MDTSDFISPSRLPKIPPTLNGVNTTNLVARWLLDGTLTDQVSARALTRAGTWNTTSYNKRWDIELNQNVVAFTGENYYTFSPSGFPSGAAAGTICGWVKYRSTNEIFSFGYGSATASQARSIFQYGSLTASFYSTTLASGISALSDGVWHHTALAYNGTSALLYVDGVLQGSLTITLATTTSAGTIGAFVDGTYPMVGYLADFRSYSASLTAAQILAMAKLEA